MSGDWVAGLGPDEREAWNEFVDHFRRDALGKIAGSAFVASLVTGSGFDVKFAVELGAAIMLDKPIIAVVTPGGRVPDKLRLVADRIVHVDVDTREGQDELAQAMREMLGA